MISALTGPLYYANEPENQQEQYACGPETPNRSRVACTLNHQAPQHATANNFEKRSGTVSQTIWHLDTSSMPGPLRPDSSEPPAR
jgi:hypothetical protein